MRKLLLQYSDIFQGDFQTGKLNLLFVFQVNCPGCFLYGFPVINELYLQNKNKGLNVLGLSTAFEDFELNTISNTSLLLKQKKTVGEAAKMLKQQGLNTYANPIDFPVAFDKMLEPAAFIADNNVEHICSAIPGFETRSEQEQNEMRNLVRSHYMKLPKVAATFYLNQLRGTPSCILFNDNYDIIEEWFGHKELNEIYDIIDKWRN